ncbi:MAG: transcription-repair coupling factor [Myxococcota bacterium]|nr:transcription-repair coupling factor [Myxococcota bacterium]MDW8360786.1 transcription-repair coupling factor [Myxococcales bacterium]
MSVASAFDLEAELARPTSGLADVLRAMASRRRTDLVGAPPSALALLLARARTQGLGPFVVVTPEPADARRVAEALAFFLGETNEGESGDAEVLLLPAPESSPWVELAPDRRLAMDRLAALHRLALGPGWSALVVPAAALVRKVAPRSSLLAHALVVRPGEELDREALATRLVDAGYVRVPVVEDPGTFAMRGARIDVWPPRHARPVRIELDDWLVVALHEFDPELQRAQRALDALTIHAVREEAASAEGRARARSRVRALLDEANWPTSRARALVEALESGRLFTAGDAWLPAFHDALETVLEVAGDDATVVLHDPVAIVRVLEEELTRARADRQARLDAGTPCFPFEAHYVSLDELGAELLARRTLVVHALAVEGAGEGPLGPLQRPEQPLVLGASGHGALVASLRARRAEEPARAIPWLADRIRDWLEQGLRVLLVARTVAQADRIGALLRPHGPSGPLLDRAGIRRAVGASPDLTPGRIAFGVGKLSAGFLLPSEALCVLTEQEIFGERIARRAPVRERRVRAAREALDDLRELRPGDYVVHALHGIGRYVGLEQRTIGQSALERMRGERPVAVEVLVVEYAGGDRLLVPVTRLDQLHRYAGPEGAPPRLDRLGGQSFARTRARVRERVQQIADELLRLYAERTATERAALPPPGPEYAELEATFPYEETPDQARAIDEVLADLERPRPMDRLVCGDVGFGKTEVAIRAAFRVAMAGRQVAVLCPTTVLAQQHHATFRARFEPFPLRVEVLSRFVDRETQARVLAGLRDGTIDVVVGTHRLLSRDVRFARLGLLVVDEEQRFGVAHKERIKQMRTEVDVLTLSATPIPRTLQLAIGGLRDISLITTPPVDRRSVRTFVARWDERLVAEAVRRELGRGGQVFYVYNRIEDLHEKAATLQRLVPEARIAVAHGRMQEATLERTMAGFVEGRWDVLCSTAIVESGLDIPRANTMLVDRADVFGLAQLYQLRGRVGRGRERAYCYLLTPPPSAMTDEARARIEALERFTALGSGFRIATLDMELRGAGELLGVEQSGHVAMVGMDMFLQMLADAVAELRGQPPPRPIDPDVHVDVETVLPEAYVEDVGVRLSMYKRLASADTEEDVLAIAAELEDRFGPLPEPARRLVRVMRVRPLLRELRIPTCEASATRVALHLGADSKLDPALVAEEVGRRGSPYRLGADLKLVRRFDESSSGDALDRLEETLGDVRARFVRPAAS